MTTLIPCPGCNQQLALPGGLDGRRVQCPRCAVEFDGLASPIPAMEAAPDGEIPAAIPTANHAAPIPTAQPAPPLQTGYAVGKTPVRSAAAGEPPAVYCIRCGTKCADTCGACPACGYPIQEVLADSAQEPWRRPLRRLPPIRGVLAVFGAIAIPVGAAFLAGAPLLDEVLRHAPQLVHFWVPFLCFAFGIVIELTALGLCLTWLYQAWRIVLRRDEDDSPELMVGLLAVPFFNFYWMFRAIPGLSTAIHDELRRLAPSRQPSTGWFPGLAACILALIPFPPLWPIAVCMFLAWMLIANNAIHRLIRIHQSLQAERDREDSIEARQYGPE